MSVAAIALKQIPRRSVDRPQIDNRATLSRQVDDIYVGGDLSKVEVVPVEQIESYHDGMRLVIAIALLVGFVMIVISVSFGLSD